MSLRSLNMVMVSKLREQNKILDTSKHLASLKTNEERVLYVYDIISEQKIFPKSQDVNKSQNVSVYYRNHGNDFFGKSENYQAWQYYNLSLLHAPLKSDHYVLALSNRSATFCSMGKYKECLKDIELILSMKYPGSLKDKLLKRQRICHEALNKDLGLPDTELSNHCQEIKLNSFSIKHAKDPRYICASSKLEVVYNETMGRHVVAKEDIKVGEVLVQEDPYLVLLQKSQFLFSCSYCLSRNLNLLPCDKCCYALYCSDTCKEKALKEYHAIECSLMPMLIHMEFKRLELLALRTVIRARTDHPDWASILQTVEEIEANTNTEYRGHVKIGDKWIFTSQYYASTHTLETNINKRSMTDIFHKTVTAAVFLHLLMTNTDFMKNENGELCENVKKFVAGTLLLHLMTGPTNMHDISANMETQSGSFVDEVSLASACYGFHSLLNHSCAPNVVRFCALGCSKVNLFALRPIKKGQQIFDNYGSHHAIEDRSSRRSNLSYQYKFECDCEACTNKWPTYFSLQPAVIPNSLRNQVTDLLRLDTIEQLQAGNLELACKQFKPLCELAEALEPYAPCKDLADCQETMKQCLALMAGTVPYGYSKVVEWKAII